MIPALLAVGLLSFPGLARADAARMPTYLLSDLRYWLFMTCYALLTVMVVQAIRKAADARDAVRPFDARSVSLAAAVIFTNAIIYQIFHHIEHLTQIFQWWYLGYKTSSSKGIIFFLDLEWNHFIFDSGYFLMLFAATALLVMRWRATGRTVGATGAVLLWSMNLVQGWHAIEHTVRIFRHVQIGCEPCAGLADVWFSWQLIPLHFAFNVVALTVPLMTYFWFRMDRRIVGLFRRKKNVAARVAMA
jgi:hypothetical protein